jgi:hypothetical protein
LRPGGSRIIPPGANGLPRRLRRRKTDPIQDHTREQVGFFQGAVFTDQVTRIIHFRLGLAAD